MLESNPELKRGLETNPYLRRDLDALEQEMKEDELGSDLEKIKELISKSKIENKEIYFKLIENVSKAAARYLLAMIESFNVEGRRTIIFNLNEEKYGQLIYTKDKEQKMAHNVLIDSINILLRNCIKNNINEIQEIAKKYTDSKENVSFRGKIRKLAIFHIYSIMKEKK